jgi:hypothetical protein
VFFPDPVEVWQPARQGETYVMPFSPQTGSQSLPEQTQSELQAENTERSSYDTPTTLRERKKGEKEREKVGLLLIGDLIQIALFFKQII